MRTPLILQQIKAQNVLIQNAKKETNICIVFGKNTVVRLPVNVVYLPRTESTRRKGHFVIKITRFPAIMVETSEFTVTYMSRSKKQLSIRRQTRLKKQLQSSTLRGTSQHNRRADQRYMKLTAGLL